MTDFLRKFSRRLSAGANNIVLALNPTEVAKLYLHDTRSNRGFESGEDEVCQQCQ